MKKRLLHSGACIWIDDRLGQVKLTIISDMDNTATNKPNTPNTEDATDRVFAQAHDLPDNLLLCVGCVWVGFVVDEVYSPLIAPLVMARMGLRFPYRPRNIIKGLIEPYLRMIVEREQACRAFIGEAEALAGLAAEFPDSVRCINTDSPTVMSAIRLRNTNLLPHVTGLVGIRPECPPEVANGEFAAAARYIDEWIEYQLKHALDVRHLRLLAGVPDKRAKPDPLGAELILANVAADARSLIIDLDDTPAKGGLVARTLRADYPLTRYVQAKIGVFGPDVHGLQVDGTATQPADYVTLCRKFVTDAKAA